MVKFTPYGPKGEPMKECDAEPIMFEGFEPFAFVIHTTKNGFTVSEVTSGAHIAYDKDRDAAIARAKLRLEKFGVTVLQNGITVCRKRIESYAYAEAMKAAEQLGDRCGVMNDGGTQQCVLKADHSEQKHEMGDMPDLADEDDEFVKALKLAESL